MKTELQLDHQTILANQARPVHFALRLTADAAPATARPPGAFCVVLDRSGSMTGAPLEHARVAVKTAIKNLRSADQFALVAFDDSARVVVPLQPAVGRGAWGPLVDEIASGGSTNLTGGWMLGRDELAKAPAGMARRLLLLTDGQLNVGVVEPQQVQGIVASGWEQQGIRTATLGFGDQYDENLLTGLARATNGGFYDADSPDKLPGIFAHELEGLQALAVQNLRVRLQRLDFCESFTLLNDYPAVTLPDGRTEVALGDLVSEEERVAVFGLEVLPLPTVEGVPVASLAGEKLLQVELAYDEISPAGITSKVWSQTIRIQATQNPAEVKLDETVLSWVAVQRAARAIREATRLEQAGREEAAKERLAEELRHLADQGPAAAAAQDCLLEARAQLEAKSPLARKSKRLMQMAALASRPSSRPDPRSKR